VVLLAVVVLLAAEVDLLEEAGVVLLAVVEQRPQHLDLNYILLLDH
jgi:hypothetical protein